MHESSNLLTNKMQENGVSETVFSPAKVDNKETFQEIQFDI
jgi:hypothetical protein